MRLVGSVAVWSLLLILAAGSASVAQEDKAFSEKFSPNEAIYFSVGWRERTNARFQLSFKYRFINPDPSIAGVQGFLRDVYFAYTQTSFWDLESESAPFRDTSYKPSLFYLKEPRRRGAAQVSFGLRSGFGHESNGRDGEASRSINFFFVRPIWVFNLSRGYNFTLQPKFHLFIGDLSDNPDIAEYRGHVDFDLALEKPHGWKLAASLRKGTRGGRGSILVDLSYPTERLIGGSFYAYLHLQYFAGWGESILDYNRKAPAQYRMGILIAR